MPPEEVIAQQQERLRAHRETLAILLTQQSICMDAFAPPATVRGIREAREGIQQAKTALRAWDVQVEDLPDDAVPTQSSAPTHPAGGLDALARLLRTPEVRDKLVEFRVIFSTARDQIGLLNRYKDLHDTLQELERPFNIVARNRRRLTDDPAAWGEIYYQITDLQDCSRRALVIMTDPRLADALARDRKKLERASTELDQALDQHSPDRLNQAVTKYKSVLALGLSDTDKRLAECASDLRLDQVRQALGQVQSNLGGTKSDLPALRELATSTETLDELNTRLKMLVPNHHCWQHKDLLSTCNKLREAGKVLEVI